MISAGAPAVNRERHDGGHPKGAAAKEVGLLTDGRYSPIAVSQSRDVLAVEVTTRRRWITHGSRRMAGDRVPSSVSARADARIRVRLDCPKFAAHDGDAWILAPVPPAPGRGSRGDELIRRVPIAPAEKAWNLTCSRIRVGYAFCRNDLP